MYLPIFSLVQPEPGNARARLNFEVVTAVTEPRHLLAAMGAQMVDGMFPVLPLSLDHVLGCRMVLKRLKRFECQPNTIAFGAL